MKKQLLLLTIFTASITGAKAQAPDMGFENWAAIPFNTIKDPVGWASFNALNVAGMAQTVFEETTAPHVGLKSVKIVTEIIQGATVPNPLVPGQNLDTAGVLGIGQTQLAAPYVKYGYPYANRPATLSFAWKYTPNPNNISGVPDTAYVIANMTKWNGTSRDIIATGMFKTTASTSTYTVANMPMNYNPAFNNVMPDSQQIFISSSIIAYNGAKKGSTFYADDFVWSGYVSTGDINGQSVQVSVFPNPVNNFVNIQTNVTAEKVIIIDISGRIIGSYDLIDNKVKIATENYSSGIYFYSLLNANNEIISRDKFEVIK